MWYSMFHFLSPIQFYSKYKGWFFFFWIKIICAQKAHRETTAVGYLFLGSAQKLHPEAGTNPTDLLLEVLET